MDILITWLVGSFIMLCLVAYTVIRVKKKKNKKFTVSDVLQAVLLIAFSWFSVVFAIVNVFISKSDKLDYMLDKLSESKQKCSQKTKLFLSRRVF